MLIARCQFFLLEPWGHQFHDLDEGFTKAYQHQGIEMAAMCLGFGVQEILSPLVNVIWDEVRVINGQREIIDLLVGAEMVGENSKMVILVGYCCYKFDQTVEKSFEQIGRVGREQDTQIGPENMRTMFSSKQFFHKRAI